MLICTPPSKGYSSSLVSFRISWGCKEGVLSQSLLSENTYKYLITHYSIQCQWAFRRSCDRMHISLQGALKTAPYEGAMICRSGCPLPDNSCNDMKYMFHLVMMQYEIYKQIKTQRWFEYASGRGHPDLRQSISHPLNTTLTTICVK